ncbi:S16 family serine protease [Streptomyces sp. NPDC005438]|uniref:S16 family serine protease n=1 Tax=Streptomyces sp. NPDC005438 TaxID=3156880 RepID=UPI0033B9C2FF
MPSQPSTLPPAYRHRRRTLALCGLAVLLLFAVTALAPLPYSIAQPGLTADVLGKNRGKQVITVSGDDIREGTPKGQLLMTTIAATPPDATVRLWDVARDYVAEDRAVMPRDAVYPVGDSPREIRRHNEGEMRKSQNAATDAALHHLGRSADDLDVTLRLADVGGPSAGLLFTLGIIDKVEGDGKGGDLTGGRVIAGTGTIEAGGKVGPVGGVPLKTRAARRDGATVFLVPEEECQDARTGLPSGLRLIPVSTLKGTLKALAALRDGGRVPSC